MTDAPDTLADLSFEDAMKRLEAIVQQLESGDVPLEKSIELFTEGEKLRNHCTARLDSAKERIEQIVQDKDGNATAARPFDAD